ncbi:MAG: methyltransferase domain-containing protein [Desulfobulbaceae bacterium]|nr:methyltransferase domain-containing protein [Desulfobulbaceae bacterium]
MSASGQSSSGVNREGVFTITKDCQPNKDGYDSLMYWGPLEEYYCGSDFVNYGYWMEDTPDARVASENLMEQLLAWLPKKEGAILDVACGKGASTRHLLNYYPSAAITGINVSEKQLETCRRLAPGCRFMLMDAVALDFPDNFFDNIICVEAAFHFNTREQFFREALRVLKPGGRLVLSDILLTQEAEERRRFRAVDNFSPNLAAYDAVMRRVGFTGVEVTNATAPCFHGAYWHLIRFSHEKLLRHDMTIDSMKNFLKRVLAFVPEIRYYLLACGQK